MKATTQEEPHNQAIREATAEHIVQLEWDQFQNTTNEGGRASCQGNWPVFHQMRFSQCITWPIELLHSYETDLENANTDGRNLVTEKYARMMESTVPEEFERNIKPFISQLTLDRIEEQEAIIRQQVAWAADFRERFPHLGKAMRVLHTSEDTPETTSFETYLRGELSTYSPQTLHLYRDFIQNLAEQHINLTEQIIRETVRIQGYASLQAAEADLA